MSDQVVDPARRRFLIMTTGLGVVGAGFAAVPFVMSMTPSERARAAGAPVEIDISELKPGELRTVEWRGKPVWVLRRTPKMLESLGQVTDELADPESKKSEQPAYVDPKNRALKPEIMVVVGICTHLGCSPDKRLEAGTAAGLGKDWPGGFFCPCHGSKFDLAGRVWKNVPAPTNLPVPPHTFKNDTTIIVGLDPDDKKKGVA